MDTNNIKILFKLISSAFENVKDSHNLIFSDDSKENVALIHLSEAFASMTSADIFCSVNELDNSEFTELFSSFNIYNSEFLSNVENNHSHQWTDIEYRKYLNDPLDVMNLFQGNNLTSQVIIDAINKELAN